MANGEMGSWVVEMQAMVDSLRNDRSQEGRLGRMKPSICRLPPYIPKLNMEAYQPQVVSFGPYHHGEPHLAWMEAHKKRAFAHCIARSGLTVEEVFGLVAVMAQDWKDWYDSLDSKWQDNTVGFVQLMILDGCFMLELLRVHHHECYGDYQSYYPNEIVFSDHGQLNVMYFIWKDMMMLENQLPMLFLLRLKNILDGAKGFARDLPLRFLDVYTFHKIFRRMSHAEIGASWHLLDVYRKGLTHNEHGNPGPQCEGDYTMMGKCLHKFDLYCKRLLHYCKRRLLYYCKLLVFTRNEPRDAAPQYPNQGEEINEASYFICPATELHEAGVRFKKSKSNNLQDVTFDHGVLRLPNFTIDDHTEAIFLNLIAFERCYSCVGTDITSFVAFMDRIIDDDQDIKLLSSNGIIHNAIGRNSEAANLFNNMGKELVFDDYSKLGQVHKELTNYSNKQWNKWRANLIHTYFKNPWAIISVIAALLLFSLTAVQTIFTILK